MTELGESNQPVIDDRETRLIYENEKLKIKIDELNEIIESTGALNVQEIKTQNTVLHQQVEQLQSQLQEKERQMEILRADNSRFESIHSTLETVFNNLQVKENEMRELKTSLKDKENEITQITQALEANKEKLSEQETHTADELNLTNNEIKQLQLELHNTQVSLQEKQQELVEIQKVCNKLTTEAEEHHNQQLQNDATKETVSELKEALVVKENELKELQKERDALLTQHNELQTQHVRDVKTLEELQRQVATLQKETEVKVNDTSKALSLEQLLRNEGSKTGNNNNNNNSSDTIDLHSPVVEEYVQKCVKEAVANTERRLKEQTDMNAQLLSYKSLVQQENEAAEARAGVQNKTRNNRNDKPLNSILSLKNNTNSNNSNSYSSGANSNNSTATTTPMASDNARASYDALRLKQEELQHSMQERVAAILAKSAVSKEDIQELLQQMLDYQETADEDFATRILIQSIQNDDRLEEYKKEMLRVKEENVSLSKVCKAQTREMEILRKQYNELQEQLKEARSQHQQQQEQWDQHRHRHRNRHFDPESKEVTPNADKNNNNDNDNDNNNNKETVEGNTDNSTAENGAIFTNLPTIGDMVHRNIKNNVFQTNVPHPMRVKSPHHQREGSNAESTKLIQCPWCTFEQPIENVECTICQRPLQPAVKR